MHSLFHPHFSLLVAACLLAAGVQARPPQERLPERFSVVFDLRLKGMTLGRTRWSLAPGPSGTYLYRSESTTTGLASLLRKRRILEQSEWRYHGHRIRPVSYSYERSGGGKERRVDIAFDWRRRVAAGTKRGKPFSLAVPEGTLDKLSYLLALMRDLAAGETAVAYRVAAGGKLNTYRLEVVGEEQLATPVGTLRTLKVRRVRRDDKRQTTLWCAPRFGYLPVRIEHRERDGSVILLQATRIEGLATPAR